MRIGESRGYLQRGRRLTLQSAILLSLPVLLELTTTPFAAAQITPDDSLGAERAVVAPGVVNSLPSDLITGGARRGTNLFHSFQQFVINEGRGAYFDPGLSIANIFTRVTGGRSDILGTLGVLNSSANLYLISPNGILFGPSARLDLEGSFLATTANAITFPDGSQYGVTNQDSPPLIITVPIGLQFGATPGDILVQRSDLRVQPGQTLALVGGALALDGGNVSADGGRIELGSVAKNSTIQLNFVSNGLALGFSGVKEFQSIAAINGALINAGEPGGTVTVTGGRVSIQGGSQLSTTTFGVGNGGDLTIRAIDSLDLEGKSSTGFASGLFARVNSGASGRGGNLYVETKSLKIRNGAVINTSTDGRGDAGNVEVRAASVEVDNSGTIAAGVGGRAEGNGGSITLETQRLNVSNSQISTSTFGSGNAGNLTIRASESLTLDFGGVFAQVLSSFGKEGGNLSISTGKLEVFDGSVISTSSLGLGSAGNLSIRSQSIKMRRGNILAETTSGNGGNINLQVQDYLLMTRGSKISTTAGTAGTGGNGGNITINSNFIVATPRESNTITANAFEGSGGKISITTRGLFGFLEGIQASPNSFISASSTRGIAGEVNVNTLDLNPSRAVIELPSVVIDPFRLISQNCRPGQRLSNQGRFVIRGGADELPNPGKVYMISSADSNQIVEAQGLARTGKTGEWIVLSSTSTQGTTTPNFGSSLNCYEEGSGVRD